MAREMIQRNANKPMNTTVRAMKTNPERLEYLGALLENEQRLVLVSVDPKEPWEAFRKLRRTLRKEPRSAEAVVDIFETTTPIERQAATVITLESRRRAG